MAEVSGANVLDRLSISRPWKKPARSCASVKPKISDAWNRWSAGLSCATFGVSQSFSFQGKKVWVRSSLSTAVSARADARGCRPQPRVDLGEVDLSVLLQTRRGRDDLRVRSLPVVHPRLTGLVGAHPQQDGGGEVLPHVHPRLGR